MPQHALSPADANLLWLHAAAAREHATALRASAAIIDRIVAAALSAGVLPETIAADGFLPETLVQSIADGDTAFERFATAPNSTDDADADAEQ